MQRLLIAVLAAMLAAPNAHASDPDARAASEELIARGVDARLHERHEEALDLFRKAHVLSPSARTFAQMGLAEISLHRWIEAEEHLATALRRHDVPWAEDLRVRGVLETALEKARSHIGTLMVVGTEGAEILIEGRRAAVLPMVAPLRLAEGKVRVAATAPGWLAREDEAQIVGGQPTVLVMKLLPVAPAPPAQPTPPATPAKVTAPPRPIEPVRPASRWQTWTGLGLLVASAGAFATGAILVHIDGHGTCSDPPGYQCPELWKTKTLGIVTVAAGALGAATGVALIIWQPGRPDGKGSVAPGGLSIAGMF